MRGEEPTKQRVSWKNSDAVAVRSSRRGPGIWEPEAWVIVSLLMWGEATCLSWALLKVLWSSFLPWIPCHHTISRNGLFTVIGLTSVLANMILLWFVFNSRIYNVPIFDTSDCDTVWLAFFPLQAFNLQPTGISLPSTYNHCFKYILLRVLATKGIHPFYRQNYNIQAS